MKNELLLIICCLFLLICGELYLRKSLFFADTVLVQYDPDFEYITQPNQKRYLFKKNVLYNEYSLRNEPIH